MHKFYEITDQYQICNSNPKFYRTKKQNNQLIIWKSMLYVRKKQTAYRCYHSTDIVLVKVQNDLLKAIDNGSGVFILLKNVRLSEYGPTL